MSNPKLPKYIFNLFKIQNKNYEMLSSFIVHYSISKWKLIAIERQIIFYWKKTTTTNINEYRFFNFSEHIFYCNATLSIDSLFFHSTKTKMPKHWVHFNLAASSSLYTKYVKENTFKVHLTLKNYKLIHFIKNKTIYF